MPELISKMEKIKKNMYTRCDEEQKYFFLLIIESNMLMGLEWSLIQMKCEIDLYIIKSETVMVSNPNTQLSHIHVERGSLII